MRIRKFNESESYDLSFDGFKEVMTDITDDLNTEFDFRLYDEINDDIKYYECAITLRECEYPISDVPSLDYGFIDDREGGIPFIEDPSSFESSRVRDWLGMIDKEKGELLKLKSKIDSQINKNKELGDILVKIAKIQSRLKSFDNFDDCKIGFDSSSGILSIYFEYK